MSDSGRVRRNGFADSQLSSVQKRLLKAFEASAREAASSEVI